MYADGGVSASPGLARLLDMEDNTTTPSGRTLGGADDPVHHDIALRNAALVTEIRLLRGGVGDPASLRRALRESVLYTPRWGEDGLTVGEYDGIQWLEAFTSPVELARFATERGIAPDAGVGYLTVRGDRLLDQALPALGERSGLAIDVAGREPMLIPAGVL